MLKKPFFFWCEKVSLQSLPVSIGSVISSKSLHLFDIPQHFLWMLNKNWHFFAGWGLSEKTKPSKIINGILYISAENKNIEIEIRKKTSEIVETINISFGKNIISDLKIETLC